MSKDKRDYIVGCFKNDDDLNSTLNRVMADYTEGDYHAAEEEWKASKTLFDTALSECAEVIDDFKAL